jgi:hypothetical protein
LALRRGKEDWRDGIWVRNWVGGLLWMLSGVLLCWVDGLGREKRVRRGSNRWRRMDRAIFRNRLRVFMDLRMLVLIV